MRSKVLRFDVSPDEVPVEEELDDSPEKFDVHVVEVLVSLVKSPHPID